MLSIVDNFINGITLGKVKKIIYGGIEWNIIWWSRKMIKGSYLEILISEVCFNNLDFVQVMILTIN